MRTLHLLLSHQRLTSTPSRSGHDFLIHHHPHIFKDDKSDFFVLLVVLLLTVTVAVGLMLVLIPVVIIEAVVVEIMVMLMRMLHSQLMLMVAPQGHGVRAQMLPYSRHIPAPLDVLCMLAHFYTLPFPIFLLGPPLT